MSFSISSKGLFTLTQSWIRLIIQFILSHSWGYHGDYTIHPKPEVSVSRCLHNSSKRRRCFALITQFTLTQRSGFGWSHNPVSPRSQCPRDLRNSEVSLWGKSDRVAIIWPLSPHWSRSTDLHVASVHCLIIRHASINGSLSVLNWFVLVFYQNYQNPISPLNVTSTFDSLSCGSTNLPNNLTKVEISHKVESTKEAFTHVSSVCLIVYFT